MTKELTMEKTQLDTERSRSMPDGWELRTLGDVCEIFNGSTPLKSKREFWDDGEINWFTISDIRKQGRNIKYTQQKITSEGFNSTSITLLPKKSVLLCCTASVGEYAITDVELTTNQQFNGLVVKEKNKLFSEYLFHYSSTLKEKLLSKSGKATIDFVSMTKVKTIPIPLPPLTQQKQIVAILDKAFAAIDTAKANAEQNLQNAKELFESYLQNVFDPSTRSGQEGDDWEEGEFGNIITTLTDYHANGSYKILKKNVELKDNEDYAWMIRSTDFENNFQNQFKYIDEHAYNFMSKSKVLGNEIIMSKIGNAGKVYLMPKINRPTSLAMNLFLIRLDENNALPEFIFRFLKSNKGESQILKRVKGATTKTITKDNVRNIIILYPPLEKQKKIVIKLDALSAETKKLEAIYTQKIADLEEMKKSILQKAFSGALSLKVALAV